MTQVLSPTPEALALASQLLHDGQLVAFPTETVYGLGANALDAKAVLNIFAAKGRPADNPLIVHVYDRAQLTPLCEVSPLAEKLIDAFWPGPLTLILLFLLLKHPPKLGDQRGCTPYVLLSDHPQQVFRIHIAMGSRSI